MTKEAIEYTEFYPQVTRALSTNGLLLGCYDERGEPNVMTIGWGMLGVVWNKPIWLVMVRPSRYSYGCIERSRCFTINVPRTNMADVSEICGTQSGRDSDKFALCHITPERGRALHAPTIAECPIVYECKVVHSNDVLAPNLSDEIVQGAYRGGDFHRCFWGEILAARADRSQIDTL
jgi:flavin reductase (DIM6/NTAB) family NADH-FMN oxidoreductase RutF